MKPKKIYLNPKTIDGLKETDGEGKTMRVKAFPSKNDVEYIDLSQVWHDYTEEPDEDKGDLLVQGVGKSTWGHKYMLMYYCADEGLLYFPDELGTTIPPFRLSEISRWAYINDLYKK